MRTYLNIFVSFFMLFVCSTQTNAQVLSGRGDRTSDTLSSVQLQAFRNKFCDNLPKPVLWVNDLGGLFTREEKDTLNSIITRFERRTSIEICIVTLDTFCVAREMFDDMALHIANSWKVGKKGKNNGITICLSSGYKRMKICNGKGVEKTLSASQTKEMINSYFAPSFKNGNSYEGTLKGLNAIISMLGKRL